MGQHFFFAWNYCERGPAFLLGLLSFWEKYTRGGCQGPPLAFRDQEKSGFKKKEKQEVEKPNLLGIISANDAGLWGEISQISHFLLKPLRVKLLALAIERIMTNIRKFLIQLGWRSDCGGKGGELVANSQAWQGLWASGLCGSPWDSQGHSKALAEK